MSSRNLAFVRSLTAATFAVVLAASSAHAVAICNNDGTVDPGEICDNGPSIIADGCDSFCAVLTGWACENPVDPGPSACHQIVCGDAIIDSPDEECDDNGACCDPATCQFRDASFECREAVHPDCDVAETCPGDSAECPADALDPSCSDGDSLDCTISICNPDGSCTNEEACVESCFGPGFYQNHSGEEKNGNNITQAILDSTGGIEVCGHWITATDDLEAGLSAAEQGLCVRTQGVKQRQLFRQLITAQLNCQISEGENCEQISGRFIDVSYDECDSLCNNDPVVDGPTEAECIDALSCFNSGGHYENGACIKGTCDDDGTTECGSDEDCASEDCVRFDDSCAPGSLCTDETPDTEAEICFEKKGPASSPKICNVARHDSCNIDDTYCYQACTDYGPCVAACEDTPGCDPDIACNDALSCFEACFLEPFAHTYQCGCEGTWVGYCDYYTTDIADFMDCLYFYPTAEGAGFCQCSQEMDPLDCLF